MEQVATGPSTQLPAVCDEPDSGDSPASLDVMALNPAFGVREGTAKLVVGLIESLFRKSALMQDPAFKLAALLWRWF